MGKRKNRVSSQANLLRDEGVQALGTLEKNGGIPTNDTNNPLTLYSFDKSKYLALWTEYDKNQCLSRYEWDNLPNGLTSWNLERMLYFRGSLCAFKIGGYVYILPYTISGQINPYGLPTRVQPITYNGSQIGQGKAFELPVDIGGNEDDQYTAVILYDHAPNSPSAPPVSRYALNQIIIKDIADTLARVNINIVVSNKKLMLVVKDPKQRDIVEKELAMAFASDSPFAVVSSPLEVSSVQNTSDFQASDLFNTIKNYDAIRCFMSGISSKSFGSEKKERLVSGELAGAEEEKDLILDMGFYFRKLFCDQCNAKFGTNMSVRKRSDDYEDTMNGNGQTQEDVEEDL